MALYYSRSRYHSNRVYRKKLIDYFLPLFLFIAFAVIVILSFQLYRSVFSSSPSADAFLSLLEGRTQILPAGRAQYEDAIDKTRIFPGDELMTESSSRSALQFFRQFWMRMDAETTFVLHDIQRQPTSDATLLLRLKHGRIWFSSTDIPSLSLALSVNTAHLRIQASDDALLSIEDFSSDKGPEVVRVIRGDVTITVLVPDASGSREVETYKVSAGSELNMDVKAYQAYEKFQSPEVVFPLSEDFTESEWYLWNDALDEGSNASS